MKKNSYSQLGTLAQQGFTLVELVIVMLILSALAVTAYAHISQTGSQARLAALQSFKATVLSVATMAKGICIADPQCDIDQGHATSTIINGNTILFTGRYPVGWDPNGAGLNELIDTGKFSIQAELSDIRHATYFLDGARDENHCKLEYSITSAAPNPSALSVIIDSSGC
ncbi:MAG TPA: type II secretion system protein [Methylophilus sp.]|uniref:type II secretion system protein n=1 Tax=Methylophilus sp. TaxID=29541 RepID=UPI002BB45DB3|nr:type II secretion system protein [Methylophilus sp.]HSH87373.1 type II secretion system protein [Methylophilus sp.]